jgi:outer membrane murein-binding lipoprotein Lpp
MKRSKKLSVVAVAFIVAALSGCNKQEVNSSGAEAAPNQSAPKQIEKPVAKTAPDLAAYYSANLKEARAELDKCLKLAEAAITPEIMEKCSAAQAAWEMQPYKPKNK